MEHRRSSDRRVCLCHRFHAKSWSSTAPSTSPPPTVHPCNTVHVQLGWNNLSGHHINVADIHLSARLFSFSKVRYLKVWRWNSCWFDPHRFFSTTVLWVIFTIKAKLCKINKTINPGENINILNSNIATLFLFLSSVVSVVLIFKL